MNRNIANPLERKCARFSQDQPGRNPALFLIVAVVSLLLCLASAAAAQEPIKIGVLLPKSGTYTVQGENGHNGAMLAVEDFGGKVLGRPVQLIWEDESTPQASVQRMRKMIEVDKVVAIDGGISSGDILAMMPVALQNKILLMASGPNATEITGKACNRYTFRVDLPSHVTVRTIFPTLSDNGKNKRWYFLSASYAWGIDSYNQMKDYLKEKDPSAVIVGQDQASLGTTDFSAFLLKLRSSNPQAAWVTFGGSDLTDFLKQFQAIGMTGKVLISSPVVNDSDLWAAGPQAATGTYPKLWNYTGPYNTPKSQAFAKKYQAKFGAPPEVEGWQDWFGMTAILTAIQKTGSTDSKKLVEFLEGYKFEGFKDMPIYFRSWDHQLIQPVIVARVKQKITDKYDYFDILDQFPKGGAKDLDAFYGTKQEVGCNLGPL
jgi:branched-chain amino acid transport system substrate-binding protein